MPDTTPAGAPASAPTTPPVASAPPASPPPAAPAGAGPTPASDFIGADVDGQKGGTGPQTQKPAEGTTVEEELKVTLPDGMSMDAVSWEKFKPIAKELGLKSEGAQKLVNFLVERDRGRATEEQASWNAQTETWRAEIQQDKEMGGANLDATKLASRRAVEFGGGKELRALLNETGLGNHPVVVRALSRLGKLLAEDSIAGGQGKPPHGPKQLHEILYEKKE